MNLKNYFLLALLCIGASVSAQQHITVDTNTYNTQQLIEDVLITGDCANTSSWTSRTGINYNQTQNGIGYFEQNGSTFPFENGIILTTGDATGAPGPNTTVLGGGDPPQADWGTANNDLQNILGTTDSLQNETFIQFEFVPPTNEISFRYLFVSEEYNQGFECNYSDLFEILTFCVNFISYDYENPVCAPAVRHLRH